MVCMLSAYRAEKLSERNLELFQFGLLIQTAYTIQINIYFAIYTTFTGQDGKMKKIKERINGEKT